jgi:hypothetical protein
MAEDGEEPECRSALFLRRRLVNTVVCANRARRIRLCSNVCYKTSPGAAEAQREEAACANSSAAFPLELASPSLLFSSPLRFIHERFTPPPRARSQAKRRGTQSAG